MNYDYTVIFLNSGILPEIAWRAIHSRQAAHIIWCLFLVSWRNRLTVRPCTARRRRLMTHFWVSLMNCLAVINFRQATQTMLARSRVLECPGRVLIGENPRGY